MRIAVGIIGIDGWEKYTLPAYNSMDYGVEAFVVDNGSEPPYPALPFVERIERTSYAGAINYFIRNHGGDWYVVLNNDVLCTGLEPLHSVVEQMNPKVLYGNKVRQMNGLRWVDTWVLVISKQAFDEIGPFDENFGMVGFEDADYGYRAAQLGYEVELAPLPFVHLKDSSRWKMAGYIEQRERNIEYMKKKTGLDINSSAEVLE